MSNLCRWAGRSLRTSRSVTILPPCKTAIHNGLRVRNDILRPRHASSSTRTAGSTRPPAPMRSVGSTRLAGPIGLAEPTSFTGPIRSTKPTSPAEPKDRTYSFSEMLFLFFLLTFFSIPLEYMVANLWRKYVKPETADATIPHSTDAVIHRSTLPLSAVGAVRYDLSTENLRGAYADFVELLGAGNVDLRHGELVSRSSTAWSPAPNGEADIPSMIVFPRDTQDVSNIAKICHRRNIPMIGFSGGTSLEGTLAAQHKEVCVDFNRHMNHVLAIRKADMDITVQPSVGYQDLNQILAKEGLFFPVDPGPGAQFGGMIAQGCSGTNAYRYGTMKDWVLGLEVVLADGTIINTRHRARKSSSGYDLTRLFTGSEGTLGFITKAHLKVTSAPQNMRVAVAQFPTVADAVRLAVKVVQSGHQLEAMELLDESTVHGVNEGGYCSTRWDEKPTIFMKLANPSADVVESTAKTVEAFAKECGSTLFRLARSDEEGDEIWYARKTALWSLLAMKKHPDDGFISSDPCVPISRLSDIVARSQELLAESGILGSVLGHVGDGNIHASALYSPEEKERAMQIMTEVQRYAVDLGGTVSGEHGLGLGYRDQLEYELGEESVDAMRRIKAALDPLYLMNPGKMIKIKNPGTIT